MTDTQPAAIMSDLNNAALDELRRLQDEVSFLLGQHETLKRRLESAMFLANEYSLRPPLGAPLIRRLAYLFTGK